MLCLKNRHRVLTYLLLLLFVAFFSLSFGHQSVSATSYSLTLDSSNSSQSYLCFSDPSINRPCSDYNFAVIESSSLDSSVPSFNLPYLNFSFSGRLSYPFRVYLISNYTVISLDFLNSNPDTYSFLFSSISNSNNLPSGWSITITLYDSLPSECPPVPECPPIPETQYGDILGKIYKAILLVPAMAFVLYLFYILFGWYVGGRR